MLTKYKSNKINVALISWGLYANDRGTWIEWIYVFSCSISIIAD